jgi:hypothetical protein
MHIAALVLPYGCALDRQRCVGACLVIMDALNLFGLGAVAAMLVFYALEDRSPQYIMAFGCRMSASIALRFPAGRVALRLGRGHLGRRGRSPMACEDTERFPRYVS